MDKDSINLLRYLIILRGEVEIGVVGVSMQPLLREGDQIHVVHGEYHLGDILVFPYKGELLVHRWIGERMGRILCKGDNALRTEDIAPENILGKADALCIGEQRITIPSIPKELIDMSLEIGQLLRKNHYDPVRTAADPFCAEFQRLMTPYATYRNELLKR